MNFVISTVLSKDEQKQIYKGLCICDKEFVPALSSRTSCEDTKFSKDKNNINYYFESLLNGAHIYVMAYDVKEELIAFSVLTLKNFSDLYINLCCTIPEYRGKGVGTNMIKEIIKYAEQKNFQQVFTRTWSTNFKQINILNKLGFRNAKKTEEVRRQGIYSQYFYLSIETEEK